MESQPIEIPPWRNSTSWSQVLLSFEKAAESYHEGLLPVKLLAVEIALMIDSIDPMIGGLCRQSCISCMDVCCKRASVWYDFRDLLVFYFSSGKLPQQQIEKRRNHPCPLLQPGGCILPRRQRPFICSWYLCPEQKFLLERADLIAPVKNIMPELEKIQSGRKRLENLFISVLSGKRRAVVI